MDLLKNRRHMIRLRVIYSLALAAIGATLGASYFLLQSALDSNVGDSRVINLAGRQRMLSQKMTKAALILERPGDSQVREARWNELKTSLEAWILAHHGLQYGEPKLELPNRGLSSENRSLFLKISPAYEAMETDFKRILQGFREGTDFREPLDRILKEELVFLPLMDQITFQFDQEAKTRVAGLKSLEAGVLILGLLVLMLEFLLVFLPTTRQMGSLVQQLETQVLEHQSLSEKAQAANQAKSDFLANVSHEIRTPMNAIIGFTSLLAESEKDPQKAEYLNFVETSSRALLDLINDILDLSKIEAGKFRMVESEFSPAQLLKDVLMLFSPRAREKSLDLQMQLPENLPGLLISDPLRIRQILINLVGNALKFTHQGSITLEARILSRDPQDQWCDLELRVRDTGIGILPEDRQRIFAVFEQSSRPDQSSYGGTGLGLAISLKLVGLLGGKLALESPPEGGACFVVTLPGLQLGRTPSAALPSDSSSEVLPRFKPAKILVADDVKLNRLLLRAFLKDQPLEIIEVEDGLTAWEILGRESVDLVLTDIKMPGLSGDELVLRMKQDPRLSDLPVIALTAPVLVKELESLRPHFSGVLIKPVDRRNLLRELARFISA